MDREVEGYMSHSSVQHGQSILLYYNSKSDVEIEVFRTGWYNGLGARRFLGPERVVGVEQEIPKPDSLGMVECRWTDPYVIQTNVSSYLVGWQLEPVRWHSSITSIANLQVNMDDRSLPGPPHRTIHLYTKLHHLCST